MNAQIMSSMTNRSRGCRRIKGEAAREDDIVQTMAMLALAGHETAEEYFVVRNGSKIFYTRTPTGQLAQPNQD